MQDDILFENKWIQVIERDGWYTFMHSVYSEGKAIMCLVYDFSGNIPKLLARFEHNPAHPNGTRSESNPKQEMTSITGSYEKGMSIEEVVLMELEEEAGIIASLDELESLGEVYSNKASDTVIHLYAIDGSGKTLNPPKGDGSVGEEGAYVEWMDAIELIQKGNCPLIGCAFARLIFKS